MESLATKISLYQARWKPRIAPLREYSSREREKKKMLEKNIRLFSNTESFQFIFLSHPLGWMKNFPTHS